MAGTISVIKTLIIPALISLVLFLVSSHIVMPAYRRYRTRYAQYLPLDSISNISNQTTSSVRGRLTRWIAARRQRFMVFDNGDDDAADFSDSDQELTVVDALAMPVPLRPGRGGMDTARRLSRDLEEGFRDDSDGESEDERSSGR